MTVFEFDLLVQPASSGLSRNCIFDANVYISAREIAAWMKRDW